MRWSLYIFQAATAAHQHRRMAAASNKSGLHFRTHDCYFSLCHPPNDNRVISTTDSGRPNSNCPALCQAVLHPPSNYPNFILDHPRRPLRPPTSCVSCCTASCGYATFARSCRRRISSCGGDGKCPDTGIPAGPSGRPRQPPPGDVTLSTTGATRRHVPSLHCRHRSSLHRHTRGASKSGQLANKFIW